VSKLYQVIIVITDAQAKQFTHPSHHPSLLLSVARAGASPAYKSKLAFTDMMQLACQAVLTS
jgi:hypothetical protein